MEWCRKAVSLQVNYVFPSRAERKFESWLRGFAGTCSVARPAMCLFKEFRDRGIGARYRSPMGTIRKSHKKARLRRWNALQPIPSNRGYPRWYYSGRTFSTASDSSLCHWRHDELNWENRSVLQKILIIFPVFAKILRFYQYWVALLRTWESECLGCNCVHLNRAPISRPIGTQNKVNLAHTWSLVS